ncbi:uncharacterized protein B0T23DRAFT_376866 [Neurospora hispaniola]|uniref:Uncharacterized protein n=1 Tax=Neurospora hispaniola TaxID=588809 RepID=A0AAJ0MSB4_9PEZI|nr:hypothetical protein B0T23DRAFT_376866 [Neurospora hispaniola]
MLAIDDKFPSSIYFCLPSSVLACTPYIRPAVPQHVGMLVLRTLVPTPSFLPRFSKPPLASLVWDS